MNSFAELTNQVHLINDMILSDMICEGQDDQAEEALLFSRHLLSTKFWFTRISSANKKRFLLALLADIRSGWTLSLLLKSTWNCRPKDAVLSACEANVWSSYDLAPIDHNRTAQPVPTLAHVMKNDRVWFLSLEPEPQAIVLAELLSLSGGPTMWEVHNRAQEIYDRYRAEQLRNLQDCIVLNDQTNAAKPNPATPHGKKDHMSTLHNQKSPHPETKGAPESGHAHKELEANLYAWNATIKSLRDSVKLEELEMTFRDGSTRKIWKVNRPKPEAIETVDYIQLLPAAIGKLILSYLPRATIGDYARVNKYWAYLVEDFKAELVARQKLNVDLEKLEELMLRHDTSMDVIAQIDFQAAPSSAGVMSAAPSARAKQFQPSVRASERSAGAVSFRHLLNDKLYKPFLVQKPFRNMAELKLRLERRGAADENLWNWCENIAKQTKCAKKLNCQGSAESVMNLKNLHFPCPLMKLNLELPLKVPLRKDPALVKATKLKKNISNATMMNAPRQLGNKRYSLWTKDFSKLYPVYKISSHQAPV